MARHTLALVLTLSLFTPAAGIGASKTTKLVAQDASHTVKLDGKGVLHLSPGTELVRERGMRLELDGPAAGPVPVEAFRLTKGTVEVEFPEAGPRKGVMIRLPKRVTVVAKAGSFRAVANERAVTAAALRGDALAAVGSDWKPLAEGTARSVGLSSAGEVRRILKPPSATKQTHLFASLSGGASGTVAWGGVEGASEYEVRVEGTSPGSKEFHQVVRSKRTRHAVDGLVPGSYRVMSAAVDEFGLAGSAAEIATIRVLGFAVPEGVRSDAKSVWVRRGQRVGLTHTKGVEMTYGSGSYFVPAPKSVGLHRDQPTRVRLRPVGGKQEVFIELKPVTVGAKVTVTPALPRWPQDEVHARVEYFASGTDLPSGKPSVTVNGQVVTPLWKKQGSVLSAVIPKGSGSGPWVVRVSATDEKDRVLGHGFVEVTAGPTGTGATSKPGAVARR